MINTAQTVEQLSLEVERLRQELESAQSTLDAIKCGEVDALLISDQVYTLQGADHIYRVLVEEMQEGCATVSANGTILFCNRNFADMTKTPMERVIGSSISRLLTPATARAFTAFLASGQGSFKGECQLRIGVNLHKPAIISASIVNLEGDRFACLVVTDLTAQRRSEQFSQLLFDQVKEPIIACDRKGCITQANPAALAMFAGQFVGCGFDQSLVLHRTSDGTRVTLEQAINSSSAYGEEVRYSRADGRELMLLVSAGQITADEGLSLCGCVVMFTDITEKCRLTEELTRLDRLNIVGEVAAGIGHEVRNPLTTVRGYLQMFTHRQKYADELPQFELMIEELDRANSIITEFLSLAKNKSVELHPGNLNNTVQTLLPLLQADAFRLGHRIQVEAGEIGTICYDDKEIRQLIINLVRNGLEAMEPGGVVRIRTYSERERVTLSVQDEGPGIPKEVLDRLGTPFVTTKAAGTGLGLSVCYRIAERHSAEIDVRSSPVGTTFCVHFPVQAGLLVGS